jgi:hypothetical protein
MTHRALRLVAMALVATALAGLFALTPAATASAHGTNQNGCTAVPDSGRYFDFHSSCDRHDLCYARHTYGRTDAGRKACDIAFSNNMAASCRARYKTNLVARYACYAVGEVYYLGVRAFGKPFFYHSKVATRINVRVA